MLELPRKGASIKNVPELVLEDGDHLFIPPKPSTVSVFGAVYNQNDFIYRDGKDVGDYLGQAGGPTKNADKGSLYLVKADGSVVSREQRGWLFNGFNGQVVVPGDAIVTPVTPLWAKPGYGGAGYGRRPVPPWGIPCGIQRSWASITNYG